jgi:hypothetical protein
VDMSGMLPRPERRDEMEARLAYRDARIHFPVSAFTEDFEVQPRAWAKDSLEYSLYFAGGTA